MTKSKTQEVTDFGINLRTKKIDGYVTCKCGNEIHFVIDWYKLIEQDIAKVKNDKP